MREPSFEELVEMIREKCGFDPCKLIGPETQFERDLGVTGDDGDELLTEAEKRFGVIFTRETFDLAPDEFLFGPEASLGDLISLFRNRRNKIRSFSVGELHEAIRKELSARS